MPAARTAGSGFADVSEEAQSRGWIRLSPHPWGTAKQRGQNLCPGPSGEGAEVGVGALVRPCGEAGGPY